MHTITHEQFASFIKSCEEPDILLAARRAAFDSYRKSSKPRYRYGLSIRIPPKIDDTWVAPAPVASMMRSIDGVGADVVSGSEALDVIDEAQLGRFIDQSWIRDDERTTVTQFHAAFINDILLVRIGKGHDPNCPIDIRTMLHPGVTVSEVWVTTDAGAKARIILHRSQAADGKCFSSEHIKVIAAEHSDIEIVTVQRTGQECLVIQRRDAYIHEGASVRWLGLEVGGGYVSSHSASNLEGTDASTTMTVLYMGSDEQRYDISTTSYHRASSTYADLVTRGAIAHTAKVLSRGLINISDNAADSDGYEQQDALLLDSTAEADAIPQLEIHNHDVRCSHGSTVGQVDEEQLFYLMSRGLDRRKAQQQIIHGLFAPVMDRLADQQQHDDLFGLIDMALQQTQGGIHE